MTERHFWSFFNNKKFVSMMEFEDIFLEGLVSASIEFNHGRERRNPRGAGRKTNASKLIEAGFVASWFTAEFQEIKWKSFLESEDDRIAFEACKYLTDRLFGKAPQSVSLDHSGSIDLAGELAAARERAK